MSETGRGWELSPEEPEADAAEQRTPARGDDLVEPPPEVPLDANEADAVEQRLPVRDEPGSELPREVPLDANEADVVEQKLAVEGDDDDYR
jgi:hypothetical protein